MDTPQERLRAWAKQTIADYTREMIGGGEPKLPQFAYDVLEILDAEKTVRDPKIERQALTIALQITSIFENPAKGGNVQRTGIVQSIIAELLVSQQQRYTEESCVN